MLRGVVDSFRGGPSCRQSEKTQDIRVLFEQTNNSIRSDNGSYQSRMIIYNKAFFMKNATDYKWPTVPFTNFQIPAFSKQKPNIFISHKAITTTFYQPKPPLPAILTIIRKTNMICRKVK